MNFETVKAWMTRWAAKESRYSHLKGILGLVLGPIALAVALGLVYFVLLSARRHAPADADYQRKCLWVTLALLPLLFLGNRLVPRRDLMEERMSEPTSPYDPVAGAEVWLTVVLWILFTGPRLFNWAMSSFRAARFYQAMDVHSCAAVMWMLLSQPRKVTFDEIQRDLDWLNVDETVPQLRRLEGLLALRGPPPGLTLTQELRDAIRAELRTIPAPTARRPDPHRQL